LETGRRRRSFRLSVCEKPARAFLAGASCVALDHGPAAVVRASAFEQAAAPAAVYYPPAGTWQKTPAADLGIDQAALALAVQYAQSRESTRAMDFSDQERIFGRFERAVSQRHYGR
jgi:hypothetical protein